MRRLSRAAVVLLWLTAGCAAVRAAREAQYPASRIPGERTPTAAELSLPLEGAVSLDQLTDTALRVQPAVVLARRAADAAHAAVTQAEGARFPQVAASASATYADQEHRPAGTPQRFLSFGFDVSWVILDFGRLSALARQAGEQWLAAQQDVRAAEVATAYNVRAAYFDLAKKIQLQEVAREAVRQYAEHLDQVRELARVGKNPPYDVTKAEVDLGTSRVVEQVTRNDVLTAQATLANAVGLAEVVSWTPQEDARPPAIPASFEEAWSRAQAGQPALAAAEARERAISALVDARIASLYPELSIGLGVAWSGTPTPLPWGVKLGPSVAWTPFDGFQTLATIDQAAAALRGARAALAAAAQQTWLDVRSAWLALEDARRRLELTTLTIRSAEENLTLAEGRFEVGLANSVDLTDARQSLIVARAARIEADADAAGAVAKLAQAIGIAGRPPQDGAAQGGIRP